MSKISICDVCDRRYPSIRLKYKIKYFQWLPMMMSPYTEKMQVCEKCWDNFIKLARKAKS